MNKEHILTVSLAGFAPVSCRVPNKIVARIRKSRWLKHGIDRKYVSNPVMAKAPYLIKAIMVTPRA